MAKHPKRQATLRLVGGIDFSSSSRDRETPCSDASRSRRRCHLPGIDPRTDHIETALCDRPSNSARAEGPPRRPMMSLAFIVGQTDITISDIQASIKSDAALLARPSQNVAMPDKGSDREADRDLRAKMAERVLALLSESGLNKTDFAKRMGLEYNAFKRGEDNKSFAVHSVIRLADSFDVSMDYLCGLTDEPAPVKGPKSEPDFWQLRAMKAAASASPPKRAKSAR